jgi:hypothetical protein
VIASYSDIMNKGTRREGKQSKREAKGKQKGSKGEAKGKQRGSKGEAKGKQIRSKGEAPAIWRCHSEYRNAMHQT